MEYIKSGSMYQYTINEKIAGVLAVSMEQTEDYHEIAWGIEAKDAGVAVIHILGVNPEYQKQGIGTKMIKGALELAIQNEKKTYLRKLEVDYINIVLYNGGADVFLDPIPSCSIA